jgi:outer membrane biogenesis lipoprotein LolB
MTKRRGILAAVLAAFFLLACAMPTQAMDRYDKCERRIRQAEVNLQKAIRKHGERSRQAEQRRRELQEARERCRYRDRR